MYYVLNYKLVIIKQVGMQMQSIQTFEKFFNPRIPAMRFYSSFQDLAKHV